MNNFLIWLTLIVGSIFYLTNNGDQAIQKIDESNPPKLVIDTIFTPRIGYAKIDFFENGSFICYGPSETEGQDHYVFYGINGKLNLDSLGRLFLLSFDRGRDKLYLRSATRHYFLDSDYQLTQLGAISETERPPPVQIDDGFSTALVIPDDVDFSNFRQLSSTHVYAYSSELRAKVIYDLSSQEFIDTVDQVLVVNDSMYVKSKDGSLDHAKAIVVNGKSFYVEEYGVYLFEKYPYLALKNRYEEIYLNKSLDTFFQSRVSTEWTRDSFKFFHNPGWYSYLHHGTLYDLNTLDTFQLSQDPWVHIREVIFDDDGEPLFAKMVEYDENYSARNRLIDIETGLASDIYFRLEHISGEYFTYRSKNRNTGVGLLRVSIE